MPIRHQPSVERSNITKKTILRIASYLVVFAVGGCLGLYLGYEGQQARLFAFRMVETAYYSAYTETQLIEGTDTAREEALRGFLALIEERKGQWTAVFTERNYAIDSALTNARLSALAQKRGAVDEARRYMNIATSYCPRTGWNECTADKILFVVQRLDKQGIFGLKGGE